MQHAPRTLRESSPNWRTGEPEKTTWVKIKNRAYSQAEGREDFFDLRR